MANLQCTSKWDIEFSAILLFIFNATCVFRTDMKQKKWKFFSLHNYFFFLLPENCSFSHNLYKRYIPFQFSRMLLTYPRSHMGRVSELLAAHFFTTATPLASRCPLLFSSLNYKMFTLCLTRYFKNTHLHLSEHSESREREKE
jgi:hypothetical protein